MLCYFKGHGQIFHCQLLSYKQANRDHGHTCDSAGQGSNQIQLKKKTQSGSLCTLLIRLPKRWNKLLNFLNDVHKHLNKSMYISECKPLSLL